jgi:iron complex outermembrane receptor protein
MKKSLSRVTWLACMFMLFGAVWVQAQIDVSGTVTDAMGATLPGVNVSIKGTLTGTTTDADGRHSIRVADESAILVFSFVGYVPQEIVVGGKRLINVTLEEAVTALDEVVVIGYGSVKKKDLTGSITSMTTKDFQSGNITSPDRLIVGKVAGVQITPNGGAPGSGSRIRVRGGASLNASNDPLIVLDGIPLENNNVSGSPSLLSTINPNDIESMNILKDASATAIYGSRASNGVIIITTKKAKSGQSVRINFSTQGSVSTPYNKLDLLNGDQMRDIVTRHPQSTNTSKALLGKENTDWQDEIYRTAFGTDNNLSVTGAVKNFPYRASVGYMHEDGVLKTGDMSRISGAVNLNPSFFDNHLKIDVGAKASRVKNHYANTDAIGAAAAFDPTQPVYSGNDNYGGYFTWLSGSVPNQQATYNPVALLNTKDDQSTVTRWILNGQLDYRMHFLPELRANLNLGYDYTHGKGTVYIPEWAPQQYARQGTDNQSDQEKTNKLLEFYLNYTKNFVSISSLVDFTAGYTYQDWLTHTDNFDDRSATGNVITAPVFPYDEPRNTLISVFGRLNYTLMDRYLLTATLRRDGSSRFDSGVRWGTFPSVALAWQIKNEGFMKNVDAVSGLKLRLGYGETGQQDIKSNYPYLAVYSLSENTAQYQLGDRFYYMYRPAAYDRNIKWEATATSNIALDYGFLDDRITGSIDFYLRKTKDLLSEIPIPAGSNFSNRIWTNVGNIENKGVELVLNVVPVKTADWNWDFGFNFTYNRNRITRLTQVEDPDYPGILIGEVSGATGTKVQIHSVGYNTFAFYTYRQVYNEAGNPVEGLYADLDNNGIINEKDLYRYKSAEPDVMIGFTTTLNYRKWTLSAVLRGSIGNYMFNNVHSNLGSYRLVLNPLGYIQNASVNLLETNFYESQYQSDYYIENASFLKMDNIGLTYDFGRVFRDTLGIRCNFSVQNVFTVTKYTGLDPEIPGGIDNNFYPRPRIFTLGVYLDF